MHIKNANPHYACIAVWLHSKNYEYGALSDFKKCDKEGI